jgi:hypothetical protein
MNAAVAGGAITVPADEATMGLDVDLQEGGILGAADGGEGASAVATTALVAGEDVVLDEGGQVGIVAASRTGLAGLLAA